MKLKYLLEDYFEKPIDLFVVLCAIAIEIGVLALFIFCLLTAFNIV